MQNSDFRTRITSLYWYHTSPVVLCMQTSVISPRKTCLCGSQPSSLVFGCKTARITSLYGSQTSPVVLCVENSVICTRITSLCVSQTTPVVLCMQNSMPSIRITKLYGSQPSSVVFGCKRATFGPEKQVSIGPRYHRSFCAFKPA